MSNGITSIRHSQSGATARIHEFGATVIGFTNASGREFLFVSRDAHLDGSKAIRGGIPLAFPVFGPSPTMPQHGFARNNTWTLARTTDTADSATAVYTLDSQNVKQGRGSGDWQFHNVALTLRVEINAHQLTTSLTVRNTGTTTFPFQALFHTYYAVDNALDPTHCFVQGLQGYRSYNQLTQQTTLRNHEAIVVTGELDVIHTPPPDTLEAHVTIGTDIQLHCRGAVDGVPAPVSVVVWNPHQQKAAGMLDFATEQYRTMICVEPGLLRGDRLEPGKEAVMVQTIR